jgi:hypothetical protein
MPSCGDEKMMRTHQSAAENVSNDVEGATYKASLRGLVVCEVAARLLPVQPVEELLFGKAVSAGGCLCAGGKKRKELVGRT